MVLAASPIVFAAKPSNHDSVSRDLQIGPAQIATARQWVLEKYPYNSLHLLKSLAWLDRIAPQSNEIVRMATLTHDMERAFPGVDQPVAGPGRMNDPEYYKAHAERSARIVGSWLREHGIAASDVERVEELIRAHEFGGAPDSNLVQAADSLSFLETNIDLFLEMARSGRRTWEEVEVKFDETFERIQLQSAKKLAAPMYADARRRLHLARSGKNGSHANHDARA
jgi:hypothetical protein